MELRDITHGEPWMTKAEKLINKKIVSALGRLLAANGVQESPLVWMRVADVSVHWLLLKRQENCLAPGEDGILPELGGSLADQIGKSRERVRKAIRELEEACTRLGKPIGEGLAEQMLPVVKKTQDLLHNDLSLADKTLSTPPQ